LVSQKPTAWIADPNHCHFQLVKRLKPAALHRSLSQSHMTDPILAGGGPFQRSFSGVAESRSFQQQQQTGSMQTPIRSRAPILI